MVERGGRKRGGYRFISAVFFFFFGCGGVLLADLGPSDVLILVNAQSKTSRYIAKMYRWYYPAIQDWQVLELQGLMDCSGPN